MPPEPATTKAYDLGYFDHLLTERDHRLIGRRPFKSYRTIIRERCQHLRDYLRGTIDYAEYRRRKANSSQI